MTKPHASASLDRLLAGFLQCGTWAACALTGAGLIFGTKALTAGVALFILLPVLRVVLMFGVFARQRNVLYAAITATVLAVIVAGCVIGVHLGPLAD
ncbi:hypothetical protein AWB80_04639 [Caballeronia pedi]|uniref:DUF1634 domain-containing protein n=1 Tax=Caballeronia pedi TaxID=1777141 RepID=A0A158C590_9BURK|nr:DUF1634 domain-containing protein [Caballeronia pedi]SAK77473.1 hypothetical protein AWB80_04639 [Caballeronia pedi]